MKVDSNISQFVGALGVEQAALLDDHNTAQEQKRSARAQRRAAQQDVLKTKRQAADKLRDMATMSRCSAFFQAAMSVGQATASLDTSLSDRAAQAKGSIYAGCAKLDPFAGRKDQYETQKADIEIKTAEAEQAAELASETVKDSAEAAKNAMKKLEDRGRLEHEAASAAGRWG